MKLLVIERIRGIVDMIRQFVKEVKEIRSIPNCDRSFGFVAMMALMTPSQKVLLPFCAFLT
jgi:hypothetical protein